MFFVKLAAVIAVAGLVLGGCRNPAGRVPVAEVSVLPEDLTMGIGASATVKVVVTPEYATDQRVEWRSSDTAVATVDGTGKVTAKAAGSATITVTATDGGLSADCMVTVDPNRQGVAVSEVILSEREKTLNAGDTFTLTATVVPAEAAQDVTWSSSNTAVATVSGTGLVTAKGYGSAKITATAADGKTEYCTITVSNPNASVRDLLDAGIANLKEGFYDGAAASFEAAFGKDQKGSGTYTHSVV
jgi:uncharacterized protein YjdB